MASAKGQRAKSFLAVDAISVPWQQVGEVTEGISQEAQEAAAPFMDCFLDGSYFSDDRRGLEFAMQSLINSTIERCAAVADGELVHIFEDTPDETDAICNATVREIARGIRQMKGPTNV